MKKLLIKLTLTILLPVLLFYASYEVLMRSRPNAWRYKSEMCQKTDLSAVQLMVLGNSHTLDDIWPRYFSFPAINLAQTSQTYNYDCLLLEKYLPQMTNLEYVVMDISLTSPWERLDNGPSAWLCKRYAIYFGLRNHHWWEYRYHYYFSEVSPALLAALLAGPDPNPYDEQGFPTNLERCDDIEAEAIEASTRHSVDTSKLDIYNDNLRLMESAIELCTKRDIKVIFVSCPMHPAYRKHIDAGRLAIVRRYADTFCQHPNVRWLNFYADARFADSDFVNSDHLAPCGAAKLTTIIADTLDVIYSNPPATDLK